MYVHAYLWTVTFVAHLFFSDDKPHSSISAFRKTTRNLLCRTCGMTAKSGKLSCCARGGSWFGKCGATGNTKLPHTWHEGIQACEAREPKTVVMEQQRNAVYQKSNSSSSDDGNIINFKTSIKINQIFASTSTKMPHAPFGVHNNASHQGSTITLTHMTMNTSVSTIVQARKTGIHTPVNVLSRSTTILPANPPIALAINGPVTHPVNSIITNPGRMSIAEAEASTGIDPFHVSASMPLTARKRGILESMYVAHISVLVIVVVF